MTRASGRHKRRCQCLVWRQHTTETCRMAEEKKKHEGFQRQSQNNVIVKRAHLMLRRVQAMCDCDSDAVGG